LASDRPLNQIHSIFVGLLATYIRKKEELSTPPMVPMAYDDKAIDGADGLF